MKRLVPITFTRAEYSSWRPVLRALRDDPAFEVRLVVSGTHLEPRFGRTVVEVERDGFPIAERVAMAMESDSAEAVTEAVGRGMMGFAHTLARLRPEAIVLIGDRLELLAAATAALAARIPIVHLSGGDLTEGAIDNQVRYAVTQMSHLHLVCTPGHAERLRRMGEEPWRVHVTGDPALDELRELPVLARAELEAELGLPLRPPVVVVTQHPATLGAGPVAAEVEALLRALEQVDATFVITEPNADAGNLAVLRALREFAARHPTARLFANLGQRRYYSLLKLADLMVGNSSSGIWEAPSFQLPVVNVGDRQRGRLRAANVLDAPPESDAILGQIRAALSPGFRAGLAGLRNPYGDGHATPRILEILRQPYDPMRLLCKRLYPAVSPAEVT